MDDDANIFVIKKTVSAPDRDLYYVSNDGERRAFWTYLPTRANKYRTYTLAKMERDKVMRPEMGTVMSLEDAKLERIRRNIIDG